MYQFIYVYLTFYDIILLVHVNTSKILKRKLKKIKQLKLRLENYKFANQLTGSRELPIT